MDTKAYLEWRAKLGKWVVELFPRFLSCCHPRYTGLTYCTSPAANNRKQKRAFFMVFTQLALLMMFGALVAVAGLALLYFRKEQAENRIKLFGQEFQISTPALVVFLAGCAIFVLPSVVQMPSQPAFGFRWPWQRFGPDPLDTLGPILTNGEEHEPNDRITDANVVKLGSSTKGTVSSDDDRDFFKFKAGQGLKTRIILRKIPTHGFAATVTVYNSVENKVKEDYEDGEDAVSFVFDSDPNAYYYVVVQGRNSQRGPYELLIKEE